MFLRDSTLVACCKLFTGRHSSRRKNMPESAASTQNTAIASYAYTLDAAGHRTSVTELSGRKATYGYDNLYRLTSETIASDPGGQNGTISYVYDPVGNRKQMTSTVPAIPAGLLNYDANDRFTAGDGDVAALGSFQVGELVAGHLGGGVDRGAGLRHHDLRKP